MAKRLALIFITGLLSLGAGFWVGQHPQYYQQYLDLNKSEILFYSEDLQELFPLELQREIQRKSPVKVRFISSDPEAADILLVDQNYLKLSGHFEIEQSSTNTSLWKNQFILIAADFQRDLFKEKRAVPVLWKVKDHRLRILSLMIDSERGKKTSVLWNFIQFFMSEDIYSQWLKAQDWNTTLLRYDEGHMEETRKASSVRKLNLSNTEI